MFFVIFSIVFYSILLFGVIWLLFEIIHNYKLCKERRSQAQSDDYKENSNEY